MTITRRSWPALAAASVLVFVVAAGPASGQQKSTRVAVVDPSRVFKEMQETKDLQNQLRAENERLNAMGKSKEDEMENLKKQRAVMRPDSPQVEDINKQLMQKAIEYETWGKYAKLEAERSQKKQIFTLYEKIQTAVTDVAKQQGIDLVIADSAPKLPDTLDKITLDQLQGVLLARHVLYSSDAADISTAVIASLDAKYKAGGGGNTAAPAPAPAPAPAGKK